MRIDISFLPVLAAAFLLTFARVGTMIMMLPGIGEMTVPARVRLTMALVLTAIVLPAHQKAYTVDLNTLGPVLLVLFRKSSSARSIPAPFGYCKDWATTHPDFVRNPAANSPSPARPRSISCSRSATTLPEKPAPSGRGNR